MHSVGELIGFALVAGFAGAALGWRWRKASPRSALLRAWAAAAVGALVVGALPGDWPAAQLVAAVAAAALATRA